MQEKLEPKLPKPLHFSVAFRSKPPSPSKSVLPHGLDNRVVIYYTSLPVSFDDSCAAQSSDVSIDERDVSIDNEVNRIL
jgi:hypothetical protein